MRIVSVVVTVAKQQPNESGPLIKTFTWTGSAAESKGWDTMDDKGKATRIWRRDLTLLDTLSAAIAAYNDNEPARKV
jgi:hypothetical protein